jgi:hypothetical protein
MMAHKVFIVFLVFIGVTATLSIGVKGYSFYLTPVQERPFRADYEEMKASGPYGIGLGALGASMVTIGVVTYSTRKRVRALWNLGPLSGWLEFHIFLCLLGPVLVVYHTTFKAGGVAAISLWSMLSVAASGIVGRFLYVMIPRTPRGAELTEAQISGELSRIAGELSSTDIGRRLMELIDTKFGAIQRPSSLSGVVATLFRLRAVRRDVLHSIRSMLSQSLLQPRGSADFYAIARERSALMQKSITLAQVGKIFFYWHAVHLPFTVIMFITLVLHVAVVSLLGYTWHL